MLISALDDRQIDQLVALVSHSKLKNVKHFDLHCLPEMHGFYAKRGLYHRAWPGDLDEAVQPRRLRIRWPEFAEEGVRIRGRKCEDSEAKQTVPNQKEFGCG